MSCNNTVNIFLLGLASSMKTDIRTTSANEQNIMTFLYAFSVTILVLLSIISNMISIDTFRQIRIRTTTVGIYLLVYSCCSLFGIVMLECRLFQLIDSLNYITFFLICNVVSGLASIFTRISIWLNSFITLQRSLHSFENNSFLNRIRSRANAPKQMFVLILIIFLMHIHELISRLTLSDPVAPGKFVCQIKYSTELLILNQIFTFIHLLIPFLLHIISIGFIIASISRRRAILHQTTYYQQWIRQFNCHRHLFFSPLIAMICTLPQIILSVKYSCVDVSLKWLLRLNTSANLIIYIPQSITFFLFIYRSEIYFDVFRNQSIIGKHLCCKRRVNNQIVPLQLTRTQQNQSIQRGTKLTMNKSSRKINIQS